ncbi:MAG: SRPBCC family protein [Bacteroidia bacterium]|nr:SRPBCC family protein [Bacteroidia bacterium]MDW8332785.1 SRPBCC family protein [Bacteroidia bacterium]
MTVIATAIGVFCPSQYRVERKVVISASAQKIYESVVRLSEWNRWSAWNIDKDPTLRYSYGGNPGTVGSYMQWSSKKLGEGKLTITEAIRDSRIKYILAIAGAEGRDVRGRIELTPVPQGVEVVWTAEGDLGHNPLYKLTGLFMDAMMGPDFEEGLKKLKTLLEPQN